MKWEFSVPEVCCSVSNLWRTEEGGGCSAAVDGHLLLLLLLLNSGQFNGQPYLVAIALQRTGKGC